MPSTADILRDIIAELEAGDVSLQMLKFERASDHSLVTTIVVSTAAASVQEPS